MHDDGTTTRDKSYHPEHGPDDVGPQPRSQATIYVTPEQADQLSLFQTQGGPPMAISPIGDGRWGVRYTSGPDAGRFERRTVVTPQTQPSAGLVPVELWNDGARVHFGNPIVSTGPDNPIASPAVSPAAGGYTMFRPGDLTLDPERFQYKTADDRGVTGALTGAERWEPALANPITVWQGDDGRNYVVNGHQRTDLATRAEAAGQADVQIPARVFREGDGYTPEFMRALGAYQNIAEGSGTAVDAARVLRSRDAVPPDMALPSLPPKSQLVQQAHGLAALDDRAFGMVENGTVEPQFAALVGASIADPMEQMAALDMLARAKPANVQQARFMVQDIRNSGFLRGEQTTLFGDEQFARSLVPERATVLDAAMRAVRRARTVFKAAVEGEDTLTAAGNQMTAEGNAAGRTENDRLLDFLDREATVRGPLSDALTAAAQDLAGGKPAAGVASRFLTQARALERRGPQAGAEPGPLPGGGGPAGEEGRRQPLLSDKPGLERAGQGAIPGTEPSARQAQAARDAAGPRTDQMPPNEGLFARPEPEQPRLPDSSGLPLYGGPTAIFDPAAWRALYGPIGAAAGRALAATRDLAQSIRNAVAPMTEGSQRAQATAHEFASTLRAVMFRFGEIDREITRSFTPNERAAMGRAMDAQSVFEQQMRALSPEDQARARADFDASGGGIAGLEPPQRRVVEMLDQISQHTWAEMQTRGMVAPTAKGLPFYFPRQMVMWSEGEGFRRTPSGSGEGGNRGIEQRGQNLTTAGPLRREHLTPEETQRAARAKLGPDAHLVTDIRMLPQRLAFSHRAIAGVDIMDRIRDIGREVGVDTVIQGDIPGLLNPADYFTMNDHPAFRRWTGSGWQSVRVAREFEGPLKAVLTQPPPTWYRAMMGIKGPVMSAIMFSPFIHLGVVVGRTLPLMPFRTLSLRLFRDGSTFRRDLDFMDGAVRDGLAPLGQGGSGWRTDPVSISQDANMEASRFAFVRALGGMRDAAANAAGRIGGQFLHDVVQHPHQALLWDRVFDLQVGIYKNLRDDFVRQGHDPQTAGTMAAHVANRYAGAIPAENLARGVNMAGNLLLFSRSFTLGNLGAIKDMFTGAPPHILSRIAQDAGDAAAGPARAALRRKAMAAFVTDIGLYYMGNALVQAGLQALRTSPADAYDDWKQKALAALQETEGGNPLAIFGVLPQHWNEPGKQNRVFAGTDANGRGIYLRLPPGKVGEEFLGWFTHPGEMVIDKTSPLIRPILELAMGHDTLGRPLLPPNPQTIGDYIEAAGIVVKHMAENLGPVQTIQGATELFKQHVLGQQTQADPTVSALKVLGPMTGLALPSSGYPGGPAAGYINALNERQKFEVSRAMPAIRDKIVNGDIDGARADMTALSMPPTLQRFYIQQMQRPGVTRSQMRRFQGAATPEDQLKMQMLQGAH